MESLRDTDWDVVLSDTGLSQSLLALALSRSGKKVLHLDRNDYYGGAEAALSLQEAEVWAKGVNKESPSNCFRNAEIQQPEPHGSTPSKLGFPRAYSLSLSPQIIYTRSNLLPALVSSKVYRQLEFLVVGSWWIYDGKDENVAGKEGSPDEAENLGSIGCIRRIPGSREDVFRDKSLDLRSTRALMNFLKLAVNLDLHPAILEEWGEKPFPDFLTSYFKIPLKLQSGLLALTLTPNVPSMTRTACALPRIHRHLTSIGMFGPGFGAVIPKWGGLAEVAQVACRAGAVGGGVYVLHKGVEKVNEARSQPNGTKEEEPRMLLHSNTDEPIKTRWLVASDNDLPSLGYEKDVAGVTACRSITIVSPLPSQLFPSTGEGGPTPAAVVVVFPTGSLRTEISDSSNECSPVYLMIHSSDTGECPEGQCVIYAQTTTPCTFTSPPSSPAREVALLRRAVRTLLDDVHETPKPEILWSMHYFHTSNNSHAAKQGFAEQVVDMPEVTPSFVLEDELLKGVKSVWEKIVSGDGADRPMQEGEENGTKKSGKGFLIFEDRETGIGEEDGGM